MIKQIKKIISTKPHQKVQKGNVHIQARLNNTIISLTNMDGKVLCWASAGSCGFKGARKGTPFAGQSAAEAVAKQGRDLGLKQVDLFITGPGPGRETAIRGISQAGLTVRSIQDRTPIAHNGCRRPKKRRV